MLIWPNIIMGIICYILGGLNLAMYFWGGHQWWSIVSGIFCILMGLDIHIRYSNI